MNIFARICLTSLLVCCFSLSSCSIIEAAEGKNRVLVEDIVYKILDQKSGYKVLFREHAGVYYLKSKVKDYKSILSALEESRDKKKSVKVRADATSLEIDELLKK